MKRQGGQSGLYRRIRQILESARSSVSRSVNTTQVVANWLIGREIVEEEQCGKARAEYGERLLLNLGEKLTGDFGEGYSVHNLKFIRRFYIEYPRLLGGLAIGYAPRIQSAKVEALRQISDTARRKSPVLADHGKRPSIANEVHAFSIAEIGYAVRSESWTPGQLNPNLSWTHYRTLLRVEKPEARAFYEIEAINNNWSARELERQICSLLYERLALSRDKKGLMRLATRGHEVQKPADIFKDPVVMEFLGMPESPMLVETDLETALIDKMRAFLLELGKGFAFVARQQRLTLDGEPFLRRSGLLSHHPEVLRDR